VVSGSLALGLDQDGYVQLVLSIPSLERLKELETIAGWRDSDRDTGAVSRWGLVGILSGVVSSCGEPFSSWRGQEELIAILILELIGQGIEVEGAGDGHGHHEVWGCDKGVSSGVSIVTPSEISVVR
jgi:hypothetical protein